MIIFGFPQGAISSLAPTDRAQAIASQNPSLAKHIQRVGILKGPKEKSFESVILGFEEPSIANVAIDQGILWESFHLKAEPYSREIRSSRCFKCQSYTSHSAKFYKSQARCG